MKLGRRQFLGGASLLGLGAVGGVPLSGCSIGPAARNVFLHGVASGDPLPDAVVLWTRVTTKAKVAKVRWELAKSPSFETIVAKGSVETGADRDFTVKIDATGLDPHTTYYYRFACEEETSPIGRTRTAPRGSVARLRFAMLSCASLAHGYFHVYRHVSRRLDLDAVLHLGDYIYEYGSEEYGAVRRYEPEHELLSLNDYRARHAQYKRDPDLQAAHQQHPFVCIWDDHEVADDAWKDGAENHSEGAEGTWTERKRAAQRAYSEWMPIRDQADEGRIYRQLRYGDLADIVLLDTRLWGRDRQATNAMDAMTIQDPKRTILGADQEAWLDERLRSSGAAWKLVAQQLMFGQLPQFLNVDAWDGYPGCRERVLDMIERNGIRDVVILTGDIHTSWAMDIARDPTSPTYDPATGAGALAVELITPGVSSPGLPGLSGLAEGLMKDNRHMKYVELAKRGYVVLDVTPERLQGAFWHVEDVEDQALAPEAMSAAFSTRRGVSRLQRDAEAAPSVPSPPPAAPAD
jgi:alkaline phosphatase D